MISLDRAFIKAYQRQSGGQGKIPSPHFIGRIPVEATFEPSRAETASASAPVIDLPARELPIAPQGEATWQPPVVEPTAPPVWTPKPTPEREAPPAERNALISNLRPVFEVERLQWPRHCISLLKRAESQLADAASQLQSLMSHGQRLVCVSSMKRGEGRTSTLLCLARLLSAEGHKIALVDADLRQPQLGRQFGLLPQAGWENVLLDRLPLEEALIEALDDRLTLLPARGPWTEPLPSELYRPMSEAVQRLREEHEMVLLDSGPLDTNGTEELLAAMRCDAAVLVRDQRTTSVAELESATLRLAAAGITRWQVAENFVAAAAA